MDQTRMRTASFRSLMRRIRSSPLLFLSEISTIATSGLTESSKLSAPGTSSASPQTFRSGCVAICIDRPSRTTGWSSTISTFTMSVDSSKLFLVIVVTPGHSAGHHRSAGGAGVNPKKAADQARAVLHDPQAHAVARFGPLDHPHAIVLNPQFQPIAFGAQREFNVVRLPMPQRIAHRLLSNAKHLGSGGMVGS